MSDINPMTGTPVNAAPAPEQVHPVRGMFDSKPNHQQMPVANPMDMSEEEMQFQRIAELSQLTKFATGDLAKDIPNYLTIKRIARQMVGLLDE